MLPIALDVVGGDKAPEEILAGARLAREELGVPLMLVGPAHILEGVEGDFEKLEASEVVAMDEEPGNAIRRKKDSSLVRAAEAVRDGKASAMVSAGNTGATMASALLRMGRLPSVSRPAIAAPIPVPGSTPTVLLDAGANAECNPAMLVQFAQMGSVFARERFGIDKPRVGLLSIGEEDTKGTPLVKETHGLLAAGVGINFVGNVEGRDVVSDDVDVVVTDGFTGNVVLKTLEGGVKAVVDAILATFLTDEATKEAAKVLLPALAPLSHTLDPDNTGGAVLLGVDGVCIISHGSSSARAIVNALAVARDMVNQDVVGLMRTAVAPA